MTHYRITFRPLEHDLPVPIRLRWLLKRMLRGYGFRVVKVEEIAQPKEKARASSTRKHPESRVAGD